MINKLTLKNCFKAPSLKKEFNKDLFHLIAPKYNMATRILSLSRDQYWKNKLIKSLPALKQPLCLDLACGTGDITFKLATKYKDGQITGLDITQSMIDNANLLNNFSNIKFICNDMNSTGFNNHSFDIITGSYALRNSPDLDLAIQEINRILKKDGFLAILDFAKLDNKFMAKIQYYILKYWGYFIGSILHFNPLIYGYIAESIRCYPAQSKIISLFKTYNFEIIKREKFYLGSIELLILKKISKSKLP